MTAPEPSGIDGEAAWSAAAAAVLRRMGRLGPDAPDTSAWDRLARTTVDGITVPPLGTAPRTAGLAPVGRVPGRPPYARGSRTPTGSGWDVRTLVTDPDPSGSGCGDPGRPGERRQFRLAHRRRQRHRRLTICRRCWPASTPTWPRSHWARPGQSSDLRAAQAFRALCSNLGVRRRTRDSTLGADPIGRAVRTGGRRRDLSETPEIAAVAAAISGSAALVVDGTVAHDAGAGDVAEMAYVAGRRRRVSAGADGRRSGRRRGLRPCSGFRFAATADQFSTIAKLRAARLTLAPADRVVRRERRRPGRSPSTR